MEHLGLNRYEATHCSLYLAPLPGRSYLPMSDVPLLTGTTPDKVRGQGLAAS